MFMGYYLIVSWVSQNSFEMPQGIYIQWLLQEHMCFPYLLYQIWQLCADVLDILRHLKSPS